MCLGKPYLSSLLGVSSRTLIKVNKVAIVNLSKGNLLSDAEGGWEVYSSWEGLPKMWPSLLDSQVTIIFVEVTLFFMTMGIGIVFLM